MKKCCSGKYKNEAPCLKFTDTKNIHDSKLWKKSLGDLKQPKMVRLFFGCRAG
jgi:hypothetical protein